MQYEEKYVLFIDILGFSNMVNESIKKRSVFRDIVQVLTTIRQYKNDSEISGQITICSDIIEYKNGPARSKQVTTFSDCIVVSYPKTTPYPFISTDIMDMQKEFLLRTAMLLRGGISFGNIVHTDKMLFGPAIVRAYELESKYAIYPRVILDNCISNTFQKAQGLSLQRLCGNPSVNRKDENDKYYYCNYLNGCSGEDLKAMLAKTQQKIDSFIKTKTDEKIIKKWLWYRGYIESCINTNC